MTPFSLLLGQVRALQHQEAPLCGFSLRPISKQFLEASSITQKPSLTIACKVRCRTWPRNPILFVDFVDLSVCQTTIHLNQKAYPRQEKGDHITAVYLPSDRHEKLGHFLPVLTVKKKFENGIVSNQSYSFKLDKKQQASDLRTLITAVLWIYMVFTRSVCKGWAGWTGGHHTCRHQRR